MEHDPRKPLEPTETRSSSPAPEAQDTDGLVSLFQTHFRPEALGPFEVSRFDRTLQTRLTQRGQARRLRIRWGVRLAAPVLAATAALLLVIGPSAPGPIREDVDWVAMLEEAETELFQSGGGWFSSTETLLASATTRDVQGDPQETDPTDASSDGDGLFAEVSIDEIASGSSDEDFLPQDYLALAAVFEP